MKEIEVKEVSEDRRSKLSPNCLNQAAFSRPGFGC